MWQTGKNRTNISLSLFSYEYHFVSIGVGIGEAFIGKCLECLGTGNFVLEDETHHCTTTRLSPHRLHLEAARRAHIEEWLHHPHLAAHALPLEKMLILLGGKME